MGTRGTWHATTTTGSRYRPAAPAVPLQEPLGKGESFLGKLSPRKGESFLCFHGKKAALPKDALRKWKNPFDLCRGIPQFMHSAKGTPVVTMGTAANAGAGAAARGDGDNAAAAAAAANDDENGAAVVARARSASGWWQEDIGLMADMGVDSYRLSLSWPRLLPCESLAGQPLCSSSAQKAPPTHSITALASQ